MPKNTCKQCGQAIKVMAHRGTGFCSQMCETEFRAWWIAEEKGREAEQ